MTPTDFHAVNKHVQAADLSKLHTAQRPAGQRPGTRGTAATAPAVPASARPNVCAAYQVVRPIFVLLAGTALFPPKWIAALKAFMQAMDAAYPKAATVARQAQAAATRPTPPKPVRAQPKML